PIDLCKRGQPLVQKRATARDCPYIFLRGNVVNAIFDPSTCLKYDDFAEALPLAPHSCSQQLKRAEKMLAILHKTCAKP
ncbi:MAG: hypothetical protein ACPGWR_25860, partial [Ardenticatenaceae bacterium]